MEAGLTRIKTRAPKRKRAPAIIIRTVYPNPVDIRLRRSTNGPKSLDVPAPDMVATLTNPMC